MKTVGIVGCQPRIGTTTQALQLTLCLMHMGYNAAYVEMGERDYIEKLDALYQGITIDKNDIIYCQSIPLYTGSRIALANRGRYDYVIKDYGCIGNPGFEKISFLEQQIKIVVGGAKANEVDYVEQVIEDECYEDVNCIFSFIGLSEQRDVKEMMKNKKERTYFAVYTPDPFTYVENDIYEYILGD